MCQHDELIDFGRQLGLTRGPKLLTTSYTTRRDSTGTRKRILTRVARYTHSSAASLPHEVSCPSMVPSNLAHRVT